MALTDPSKSCVGLYCLSASLRPFEQPKDEEEFRFCLSSELMFL